MGDLSLKGLTYLAFFFSHLNAFEGYCPVLPQLGCAAAHSRLQRALNFLSAAGKAGFGEAGGHGLQRVPLWENSSLRTGEVSPGNPVPWL